MQLKEFSYSAIPNGGIFLQVLAIYLYNMENVATNSVHTILNSIKIVNNLKLTHVKLRTENTCDNLQTQPSYNFIKKIFSLHCFLINHFLKCYITKLQTIEIRISSSGTYGLSLSLFN